MNTDADTTEQGDPTDWGVALMHEWDELVASGVPDPEAFFVAAIPPANARRYADLCWSGEVAGAWEDTLHAPRGRDTWQDWTAVGVNEPVAIAEVMAADIHTPVGYTDWRVTLPDLTHDQVLAWAAGGFIADGARVWVSTGVVDPAVANGWLCRAISADAAAEWRTAPRDLSPGAGTGFSSGEAGACRLAGVPVPPPRENRLPGDLLAAAELGRRRLRWWMRPRTP